MVDINNFWKNLHKPFFMLAPMEDVTDAAFRALITKYGKPDVFFTEFISADGLILAPDIGRESILRKLSYGDGEHPIVAQLFSSVPEHMEKAARMAAERGFDGIDINMGCPDKSIEKQGCGSAMIKNPDLAKEIIRAAKRGAGSIPVSIKTRIGYKKNELETWLPALLEENPALITIHARTRAEMSKVPARWEHIKEAVAIRDSIGSECLIAGNGDVTDLDDARAKAKQTGCDGVMLGRAIYGNPWLFSSRTDTSTPKERIEALLEHIKLFDDLLLEYSNFAVMKKHFKAYVSGWDNAKDLRMQLMETSTPEEAMAVLAKANL